MAQSEERQVWVNTATGMEVHERKGRDCPRIPSGDEWAVSRFSTFFFLLVASSFDTGCNNSGYPYKAQTPPLSAYRPTPSVSPVANQSAKVKVEIISEPVGARIEVNDNYVGDTPITVEILQDGGYFTRNTVIRASPTEGGDYVQTKYFSGSMPDAWHPETVGAERDQIPSRIFFDMRLGPVTPSVDVNVVPQN